jgi:hypothetical protein
MHKVVAPLAALVVRGFFTSSAPSRVSSYIAPMNPLARMMRGVLAVLTVWCIGCSSFEPMLETVLNGERSTSATCMGEGTDSTSATTDAGVALKSASPSAMQVGCGCADCIAAEPVVLASVDVSAAVPEAPLLTLPIFVGIGREPQVPPPRV